MPGKWNLMFFGLGEASHKQGATLPVLRLKGEFVALFISLAFLVHAVLVQGPAPPAQWLSLD